MSENYNSEIEREIIEDVEIDKKDSFFKILWSNLKVILFALVLSFAIKHYVFTTTLVDGNSMFPTVHHKDRLVVSKLFFIKDKITRGDIIDFYVPRANKYYLKRVIGIEGDVVEIKANSVYLNGEKIEENYTSTNITEAHNDTTKWEIPKGYVFVLGDNRSNSTDSRDIGIVPRENIVGKIVLRYYPFDRFGGLK